MHHHSITVLLSAVAGMAVALTPLIVALRPVIVEAIRGIVDLAHVAAVLVLARMAANPAPHRRKVLAVIAKCVEGLTTRKPRP